MAAPPPPDAVDRFLQLFESFLSVEAPGVTLSSQRSRQPDSRLFLLMNNANEIPEYRSYIRGYVTDLRNGRFSLTAWQASDAFMTEQDYKLSVSNAVRGVIQFDAPTPDQWEFGAGGRFNILPDNFVSRTFEPDFNGLNSFNANKFPVEFFHQLLLRVVRDEASTGKQFHPALDKLVSDRNNAIVQENLKEPKIEADIRAEEQRFQAEFAKAEKQFQDDLVAAQSQLNVDVAAFENQFQLDLTTAEQKLTKHGTAQKALQQSLASEESQLQTEDSNWKTEGQQIGEALRKAGDAVAQRQTALDDWDTQNPSPWSLAQTQERDLLVQELENEIGAVDAALLARIQARSKDTQRHEQAITGFEAAIAQATQNIENVNKKISDDRTEIMRLNKNRQLALERLQQALDRALEQRRTKWQSEEEQLQLKHDGIMEPLVQQLKATQSQRQTLPKLRIAGSCSVCGVEPIVGRCCELYFCSKACQVRAWPSHSAICSKV